MTATMNTTQPAPLTGTATQKQYLFKYCNSTDATRTPHGDGNSLASSARASMISDATRTPHGDGNQFL